MKALLTSIFLISFLFVDGQFCIASNINKTASFSKSNTISENKSENYSNTGLSILLIEDIDVDNEEDFHDNENESCKNKIKNLFPENVKNNSWLTLNSRILLLNYFNRKSANYLLFSGFSCPIYISQQVLRI